MTAVIFGALLIGVTLGVLGSGGSIITVPLLIYVIGEPPKLAIAESLLIVGLIAITGAWRYHRRGEIVWPMVWRFGVPAMLGTYLGAWLSQFVSGETQMLIFAVIMLLASRFMLKPLNTGQSATVSPIVVLPAAVLVGAVAGLVGVGGGFLIVPALILIFRLPMSRAVGTSLTIIVLQSAVGAGKYLYLFSQMNVSLNWHIVVMMAAIGAGGSVAGAAFAGRLPQHALKRLFGYSLILIAGFIILRNVMPE